MPIAFSLQDAADLATVIGVISAVGGGLWAVFTWRHDQRRRKAEEELRKQKEEPGLEFVLKCEMGPLPDGRVFLTIDCSVRNPE